MTTEQKHRESCNPSIYTSQSTFITFCFENPHSITDKVQLFLYMYVAHKLDLSVGNIKTHNEDIMWVMNCIKEDREYSPILLF
jgi:hypothetical protein